MSEHAIPQNVMEYEFKLFAGLTLKQFIFAFIGGAGTFVFLQMTLKGYIPAIFGWPLTFVFFATTLGFTFFSYEKKSLDQWIQDWIRVSSMPLIRVWNKSKKPVKIAKGLKYKPDSFPDYLLVYFEPPKSIASVRKKIQEQIKKLSTQFVIKITPENYKNLGIIVENAKLPPIVNTVAFILLSELEPIEGVVAYVRDINNKVVAALKSTKHGIIYFNKSFNDGTYTIEFEHPEYKFPKVMITFAKTSYPLFKIEAIESNV